MRFAEMVLRSLAARIESMIAEYDASTSGGTMMDIKVSMRCEQWGSDRDRGREVRTRHLEGDGG
jgi:hypothetical protein